MSELVDLLIQLNEDRLAELAEKGYAALRAIFSQLPEQWGKTCLGQLHEANRPNILRLLRGNKGVRNRYFADTPRRWSPSAKIAPCRASAQVRIRVL